MTVEPLSSLICTLMLCARGQCLLGLGMEEVYWASLRLVRAAANTHKLTKLQGGKADFALFIYCPKDGNEGSWEKMAPLSGMQEALETAEPRYAIYCFFCCASSNVPVGQAEEARKTRSIANMCCLQRSARPGRLGARIRPTSPGRRSRTSTTRKPLLALPPSVCLG
jgi:hypothetical protein